MEWLKGQAMFMDKGCSEQLVVHPVLEGVEYALGVLVRVECLGLFPLFHRLVYREGILRSGQWAEGGGRRGRPSPALGSGPPLGL